MGYFVCYAYLFAVIFGIGILKQILGFTTETSRKIIHTLIVFTWVFLYHYFWDNWQIVIVPISFIIINALSYKYKLFKMIEREDDNNNHKGTIYFSIGITILMFLALFFPKTIMATGIATFALCFGDGLAGLFGSLARNKVYIYKEKTIQGFIACIVGTMIGLTIFSLIMSCKIPFWAMMIISVSTALLELIGQKYDNFAISFGIYALSSLLICTGVIT